MPKTTLPTYQIPDFEKVSVDPQEFYYSRLEKHLQTHLFIQKPHKHDFYILVLFGHGNGTHIIDFKSYPVTSKSMFFLAPGQVHTWTLSPDTKGHILFFSQSFYTSIFSLAKLNSYIFFNSNLTIPLINLEVAQFNELVFSFQKIEEEISHPSWSSMDLLKSYTNILLTLSYRYYLDQNPQLKSQTPNLNQFQKLEKIIEEAFTVQRDVNYYATQMNMSLKQLNLFTQKKVGKPISKILIERVILESKRLLVHSDLSVSEIAFKLQFVDPSYFSRLFKKKTSYTPEEFRLLQKSSSF
ncbi:helix-turn-helix domain-containing protein [Algoriphagus lutimaris]|uniref:AraC family transcriptional regulator n=1 Tax=Algoriphagus lutimaris TaxID=613197 RepID=UPI00196AF4E9|nr:AraC family transcriptional regulator [Algoriphagus lutimaris]MBN3521541.1 helix-turn-helix domain-containing protein [Algoriphagus lutimaris]